MLTWIVEEKMIYGHPTKSSPEKKVWWKWDASYIKLKAENEDRRKHLSGKLGMVKLSYKEIKWSAQRWKSGR